MSYTPSSSLVLGRSFGRYELLFRVASGGMAEVYAGRVRGEAGFQKLVAVKCMLPQLSDDPEFVKMFLDEARLAAHISSPHVVSTLDLGRSDDTEEALYIVMELVVGTSMAKLLRRRAKRSELVPVGVGCELVAQAAQGLHDAHEATTPVGNKLEIVHRDVSPQNILVGADGRVRLTDFGVARAVHRVTQTVAGRVKGKFAYCSPEQIEAQGVDRRSDVFSLGVVAWETLAMQRLFAAEHPLETMERVKTMPVPSLTSLRDDVPGAVADVIAWALARDPADRPPTARAFSEALAEAARESGQSIAREEVVGFLEHTAGSTLERMRDNLKRALAQSTDFHDLAQLEDAGEAPEGGGGDDAASGVTTKHVDDMGPTAVLRGGERPDAEPSVAATQLHPKADADAGPTVVDPQGSSWLSSGSSDSASAPLPQGPDAVRAQAPAAPEQAASAPSPRAAAVDWLRRHPMALAGAATASAAALAVGVLVVTSVDGSEPASEPEAASAPDTASEPEAAPDTASEPEAAPDTASEPEAAPDTASEPGAAPDTASETEAASESEPETATAGASAARRSGSRSPPARRNEPTRDEPSEPEPEPGASSDGSEGTDGSGATESSEERSSPGEPTTGPSLMGLEDFERDLGQ